MVDILDYFYELLYGSNSNLYAWFVCISIIVYFRASGAAITQAGRKLLYDKVLYMFTLDIDPKC